ncbi:MAG: hypothetical protein KJO07_00900 [Deltaproteobacteria bacterium]|nr:hypothetical protein [Deltaproteobacteria bacterium]
MNKLALIGMASLALVACGDDGGGGGSCSGAVDIQVVNSSSNDVVVESSSASCSGSVTAASQSTQVFTLFSDDLAEDDLVRFQIDDAFIDCTVTQQGVDLTYVRAEVDFAGQLQCDCNFAEYSMNDICQ